MLKYTGPGDKELDNVSELSEKMSVGSIEFSSSSEEEEIVAGREEEVEIHEDDTVVSGDLSDSEFIEAMVRSYKMKCVTESLTV